MKILTVTPTDDYHIVVCFDNHQSVILDMSEKLLTLRFSGLRNKQTFGAVHTDGKALYWPGGISIASSEVIELILK